MLKRKKQMGLTDAISTGNSWTTSCGPRAHGPGRLIAVRSATTALLEADIHLAEQVIGEDELIDAKQSEIEGRALPLLARQAPVAGELRTIVGHVADGDRVERMGDLADIAEITRLRYPESAVPETLRPNLPGWAMSRRRW